MEIKDLIKLVAEFRDERDWKQFHNPKDLANAIAIEAGELMEQFLWKSQKDSYEIAQSQDSIDEFADVVSCILLYADACGIDVARAVSEKLEKNRAKYPVEKAKGVSTKYTNL